MADTATIFRVQRFSVHDGPGIRTTVFFKGCPLRCPWCHNPEGLDGAPELQFFKEKCLGCGRCADRSSLSHADACPSGALTVCGERASLDEVVQQVLRDRDYYGNDGGVTLSGGECLLQADFVAELIGVFKAEGIRTAIDTSGAVPWSAFEMTMAVCDLYLYDIKCMDAERHKKFTGVDNARILDNARRLSALGKTMWVRIPVIPSFNDDEDEMHRIADFVNQLPSVERVTLMPYHTLGKSKYETLGKTYTYEGDVARAREAVRQYEHFFNK